MFKLPLQTTQTQGAESDLVYENRTCTYSVYIGTDVAVQPAGLSKVCVWGGGGGGGEGGEGGLQAIANWLKFICQS